MKHYTGLDVSLKTTFMSIVDENGTVVHEEVVRTEAGAIHAALLKTGVTHERIGIESGQLSISLCKSLLQKNWNIVCVDARHMAAALSARINKNDQNDARGIAQMLRAGLFKTVQIKSDENCQKKILLGSRTQLVEVQRRTNGTIRGLLKIHGIVISGSSASKNFLIKVHEALQKSDVITQTAINALLKVIETIRASLKKLDAKLVKLSRHDPHIVQLTSIPGVGVVTAMTYQATLDDPCRFVSSDTVGAYMGLTPKQYASGEVDHHGHISKMGPKDCRTLLYEAAISLLCVSKEKSKLKQWGSKLLKKKGLKKAAVAVARKLAVIMHRMLVTGEAFQAFK